MGTENMIAVISVTCSTSMKSNWRLMRQRHFLSS